SLSGGRAESKTTWHGGCGSPSLVRVEREPSPRLRRIPYGDRKLEPVPAYPAATSIAGCASVPWLRDSAGRRRMGWLVDGVVGSRGTQRELHGTGEDRWRPQAVPHLPRYRRSDGRLDLGRPRCL